MLKGKKVFEKVYMLEDESLNSQIVDKLANDTSKKVRMKAVLHKNITQKGLYTVVSQKKNFDNPTILRYAYSSMDNENKFKAIQQNFWKNYTKINDIAQNMLSGLKDSIYKDQISDLLKNEYLEGAEEEFIAKWLFRNYDIMNDKELIDIFMKQHPNLFIQYREIQKLSKQQISIFFDNYLERSSKYWSSPIRDLGYYFLEELSSDDITKLLERGFYLTKRDIVCFEHNPNFKPEHTNILLDEIIKEGETTDIDIIRIVLGNLPLDRNANKKIHSFIVRTQKSFNGSSQNMDFKALEFWTNNKTHDKKMVMTMLHKLNPDNGWSNTAVYNAVGTGKYTEKDVDYIMQDKEYYKNDLEIALIDNPMISENKLREIWKTYWVEKWNQGEIPGKIYAGVETTKIHKVVYKLITTSKLKNDFGIEYFKVTNDDSYISSELKDIFLL